MLLIEQPSPTEAVIACPRCEGSGDIGRACPTCIGFGSLHLLESADALRDCDRCSGRGRLGEGVGDPVCAKCFGAGVVTARGRAKVKPVGD